MLPFPVSRPLSWRVKGLCHFCHFGLVQRLEAWSLNESRIETKTNKPFKRILLRLFSPPRPCRSLFFDYISYIFPLSFFFARELKKEIGKRADTWISEGTGKRENGTLDLDFFSVSALLKLDQKPSLKCGWMEFFTSLCHVFVFRDFCPSQSTNRFACSFITLSRSPTQTWYLYPQIQAPSLIDGAFIPSSFSVKLFSLYPGRPLAPFFLASSDDCARSFLLCLFLDRESGRGDQIRNSGTNHTKQRKRDRQRIHIDRLMR